MARPSKLSRVQRTELVARYKAGGVSQRDLAKEYGVSSAAVAYYVKRAKTKKAPLGAAEPPKPAKRSTRGYAHNGMIAPGVTGVHKGLTIETRADAFLRDIATEFNMNQSQLVNYLLLAEAADHAAGQGRLARIVKRLMEVI